VFLWQGDDDRNLDASQTIGLIPLLRARNIYFELLVVPDDMHEGRAASSRARHVRTYRGLSAPLRLGKTDTTVS
jgi:hypothetical protein